MLENLKSVSHVAGCKQVLRVVCDKQAAVVLLASDAEEAVRDRIISACTEHGVEIDRISTMEQLGKACGIAVGCAAVAILK